MLNEAHTVAVLVELRRIGVDLGSLNAPLVGTGLRASELRDWLRTIPDGAGAGELLRRLDERARTIPYRPVQIHWTPEPPRPEHRGRRKRDWPTLPLLNAGTDLLMEEWDPFGFRLAGTERETIAEFAFHFFGPLLAPRPHGDPITHTTEMIASAERDRLALTPSPEPHRRYLARRLQQLVEEYPVPPAELPPSAVHVIVSGNNSTHPARDPEGVCARCHAFGTVARVAFMNQPSTAKRFCAACWREVRDEYVPQGLHKPPQTAAERVEWLDRSTRPPVWVESRSWDDTLDSMRPMTEALERDPDLARREGVDLAQIADELAKLDDVMDGPMPPEVEAFIRQHGSAR